MKPPNPLIVALDRSERDSILHLVDVLAAEAGLFKIGLEAFVALGPSIVREVTGHGAGVFLDLKLHDIPNTVARAVSAASALGVSMITLHAAGGEAMMRAAREAAERANPRPLLLAVTVLTSLDAEALRATGCGDGVEAQVGRLASLAASSGIDGVVASPREARAIRSLCGDALTIVTPGIRFSSDAAGDQKRTLGPREAIEAGADYIVVGRPITEAADPLEAARAMRLAATS